MKPSLGRIVLIKVEDKNKKECIIPAVIVKVWSDTSINVVAFNDGQNDLDDGTGAFNKMKAEGVKWFTSLTLDTNESEPSLGHWIWPPRV